MIGFFSFSIQIFRLVKSCLQIILTHALAQEEKCVSASADNKSMVARVAANICGYFFVLFIKSRQHLVKMEVSKKEKKYVCYTTEKASERICQELD